MDGFALVDQPRSGGENMAVDQAMLDAAATKQVPLLRIYRWAKPTVSLGYFQKYADYRLHHELQGADCVRRSTGGGAIVHDHDWTYSLALPDAAIPSGRFGAANPVYDCVHKGVVQWLRRLGVAAEQWREDGSDQHVGRDAKSFLCFERRSDGDVVAKGAKILGSAQRRRRGAIVQHGSLLLRRSNFAPQLSGAEEVIEKTASPEDSRNALARVEDCWQMLPVIAGSLAEGLRVFVNECDAEDFFEQLGPIELGRFEDPRWHKRV